MLRIKVIVFDLDGVLLESADIKTEAFRVLFEGYPDRLDQIIKYHKENGGLSRFKKFEFIYKNILKMPYDDEIKTKLGQRFEELALEKVMKCPFVDGAIEFLDNYHKKIPLYVVSGTPDLELKEILKKRDISKYFVDIFGSSKEKPYWLNFIINKEKIQSKNVLFIGDSLSDYRAAVASEVNFIGRINNRGDNIFPKRNYLAVIKNLKELSPVLKYLTNFV